MKQFTTVRKTVTTAVCMALCVILPLAVHAIPNSGKLLSPMHLPVLLCGLVCGWQYGLLCGLAGPVLACMISGMPAAGSHLYGMLFELPVYGMVSGLLMRLIRTGRLLPDLYISLLTAMLAGRITGGIAKALFFSSGAYTLRIWVSAHFVSAFPGILLQLLLLPTLYLALLRAGLLPDKYHP